MKTILLALTIFILGCSTQVNVGHSEEGIHSWNTYHWAEGSFPLDVKNNMKDSVWQPFFDETVQVWDGLEHHLSIYTTTNQGSVVTESRRSQQWLGLASIYVDNLGHITSGKVTMNPTMLSDSRYTDTAIQHVFCQEMGHILGLGHIAESTTCMDDCAWADTSTDWLACLNNPLAEGPDAHDAEQLDLIYGHEDDQLFIPDGGVASNCGNSRRPGCRQEGWIVIHSFPIFVEDNLPSY